MKTELFQKQKSIDFYENRYKGDYMSEWPKEKKERVFDIIRNLELPDSGNALDFGCGNGVFTDVLKQALPNWQIYGCDISRNAIKNAKKRFPECTFFASDDEKFSNIKFDFLLSHHVMEHVFDIKITLNQLNGFLKSIASALLIFPCGNEGSFEYNVCKMRIDGINAEMENRFFFEEEGHLRRLTTEQTNRLMDKFGFELLQDFYSSQYYGALKWLSRADPKFILNFANPNKSNNSSSYKLLRNIRIKLLLLNFLQRPCVSFNYFKTKKDKNYIDRIKMIIYLFPLIFSYPVYTLVNFKAKEEWDKRKSLKNGSEMYLYYNRK